MSGVEGQVAVTVRSGGEPGVDCHACRRVESSRCPVRERECLIQRQAGRIEMWVDCLRVGWEE